MKLTYTTKNGRMTVELDADNQKEIFRQLHSFQEIFEDTAAAYIDGQKVESDDIRFRVRKSEYEDEKGKLKTAEYFEAYVGSGELFGWKKAYGVLDNGTDDLFPKRRVEDDPNTTVGFNGWHKYNKPA